MTEQRLFGGSIHSALIHAATRYDERQARGKRHNVYALAQYFKRIDAIDQDIASGADTRAAICAAFTGPLLSAMLKAAHLSAPTRDELSGAGKYTYQPVARSNRA